MKTIIQRGHLIDPSTQLDKSADIYIDNQLIVGIDDAPIDFVPDQIIDARDKHVIPGLVDVQCRVRQPGSSQKANTASETNAAAHGGITSICLPPDVTPVTDNAAVVELIHHNNQKAGNRCHLYTIGALSKGLEGEQLSNMGTLKRTGCVALSNALKPFGNNLIQRRAMEYAAGQEMLVVIQPYDQALHADGCAHEGSLATRLGLPPIPEAAETAALAKDIELVAQTSARTHFGQLSCARSVDMIRQAKKDRLPVTADVAIHHLFLTDRDIDGFDTNKLTFPPLRSEADRDALREGLKDGTIDCICSDHQPHDIDAKLQPFPSAEPGISGLDTLLPLIFRLVDDGILELHQAIAASTSNPAKIFKLPAGQLATGELADLVIVDRQAHYSCEPELFYSAGKNTAFKGWDFSTKVVKTLVAGKQIQ
ncbi:MAG: dihydroorotase [Gammaproteobacteria bacterium]|nr:dihydroorotase [Gammaproteobacteria bacterium]